MVARLTLTIDGQVIKLAKKHAKIKGCSLSALVESYLKAIVDGENTVSELTPHVRRLQGSIKLPQDFDYKRTLAENLSKKHTK